jgi:hypothetical protein
MLENAESLILLILSLFVLTIGLTSGRECKEKKASMTVALKELYAANICSHVSGPTQQQIDTVLSKLAFQQCEPNFPLILAAISCLVIALKGRCG